MTAIAVLLSIALVGLFIAIGLIIAVVLDFRKLPSRIERTLAPPKDSAIELFNTGKSIVDFSKRRYDGYVKHGTRIVNAVKESADEVSTAAKSVNVDDAKGALKTAAASINAAQEGLAAAKAIMDVISKSQKPG